MPDQNNLLQAIRVVVREEVQPVRDDVHELKGDMREVKQRLSIVEETLTVVEKRLTVVETKVDKLPEQLLEMIAEPLIQEDKYQDTRINRLEKHSHLPPLPRTE